MAVAFGFTSDLAGRTSGVTAAMLSACFAADLGKTSCCWWSALAVSCCALLLPAPRLTEAASSATPARRCRPRYFQVIPNIFESSWIKDRMPQLVHLPQTNAASARIDIRSTFGHYRGGNRIFAYRALADGIFAQGIFADRRSRRLRLRPREVGSSCCSHEG